MENKSKRAMAAVCVLTVLCMAGLGIFLAGVLLSADSQIPAGGSPASVSSGDGERGSVSAGNVDGGDTIAGDTGVGEDTKTGDGYGEEGAGEPQPSEESAQAEEPKTGRIPVKGIYVTGPMAGSSSFENLIALVEETELNTMVIDVKNDSGEITYQMDLESAKAMGACVRYIRDMDAFMAKLKEHGIYTIARIVCFKDPYLAANRPELALKKADGTAVTDAYGLEWVNPCKEEVWEYLTDVALAAADAGFDEIQYDYVRFPIGKDADAADYGVTMESDTKQKSITGFLTYTSERLHEKGVLVTADVFGTIIGSEVDVKQVGQDYVKLGSTVDVLCPMVYPSHYADNVFGYPVPDAEPYGTVFSALTKSAEELSAVEEQERAVVRPWLQAFTATWVKGHIRYGGDQIREQIQAVYDAGYEEWILWNASNRYTSEGLLTEAESESAEERKTEE